MRKLLISLWVALVLIGLVGVGLLAFRHLNDSAVETPEGTFREDGLNIETRNPQSAGVNQTGN